MNNIQPPPNLNLTGNLQENWKRFKQRFELYLQAIEADEKSDERKIALFLTVAGPESIEVFNTLTFTEEEKGKYDVVVQKFEDYCTPRKNETYERYIFRCRMQKENETFEQFVTDLKIKSQSCNFGTLSASLIKDQIVIGIADKKVKERLLREYDLDLEKAIQICQAAETAKSQMKTLEKPESEATVGAVSKRNVPSTSNIKKPGQTCKSENKQNPKKIPEQTKQCGRCGRKHEKGKCSAINKVCNRCHKIGHLQNMCFTKHVETLTELSGEIKFSDEEMFLGSIENHTNNKDWMSRGRVNGTNISFKLDTGAQVNVLPSNLYNKLNRKPKIEQRKIILKTYTGEIIPTTGVCQADFECNKKKDTVMFVIVPQDFQPVLGLKACEKFNLIKRVHAIKENTVNKSNLQQSSNIENSITLEFEDVFKGIGCLPVTYKIKLRDNAVPVIHAARKVPVSLREKLKKELDRLLKLEIIKKIEEPTEWVNSLVIVEKSNGDLRLCLDPKDLNKYIMREHHHIPTRSEIASNMARAKYFSID